MNTGLEFANIKSIDNQTGFSVYSYLKDKFIFSQKKQVKGYGTDLLRGVQVMNSMKLSRREFLWLSSLTAAGAAAGCASNPVTGQMQLMLLSEDSEIKLDHENSPHQFSTDYGIIQDTALNSYIKETGKRLAAISHRPQMPYLCQCVNAVYINAYAFPGGSIAITRGMLLKLKNEAELAAVLGHELGHVNARHTAQQMSKGLLTQAIVGTIALAAGTQSEGLGRVASELGMFGAGALLASYSREHEREADALGMEYAVKAGYGPDGCVGVMEMLNQISKQRNASVNILFATHPMSDERYRTAVTMASQQYSAARKNPLYRERYMDNTARLRTIKDAIEAMQKGEEEMAKQKYPAAEDLFEKALQKAPEDYAGLVLMAKCQLSQEKYGRAREFAEHAKQVYPSEAQAYYLCGFAKIKTRNFESAYQDFTRYDKLMPGNPNATFFKGLALENMRRTSEAAQEYKKYLQVVQEGDKAQYAYKRLVEWGYVGQ